MCSERQWVKSSAHFDDKEYDGTVNIGKVNVDQNPQLSINYGITSIPAILFVKGGKVVDKLVGSQPKGNFVKKIEALK
jgi:thioredoxin 1